MLKDVRAVLGLTLLLGAFTVACDNNPLKDNADKGFFMYTNPSFGTLQVGGTTKVRANVENKYSAPTGDAVTGTPCDAKITAVADTSRTVFEEPERFVVTGVSPGKTCLIVSGGGVTDTVDLIVGPVSVHIVADSTIASGQSKPLSATFPNPVGTLTVGDVIFSSSNPAVVFVDTTTNTMSGRAPGTTFVLTTLRNGRGMIVTDSQKVTVSAGAFTGVAPASIAQGTLVTLTAGANPFDSNTAVTVNGQPTYIVTNTPTTLSFVSPATSGTTAAVSISNIGPNEISSVFSVPQTADPVEPDSKATARTITLGTSAYGQVSATDPDDWYVFTAPASGTLTVDFDWVAGGTTTTNDVDVIVTNAAGTDIGTSSNSCETSSHPEHCTFTVTAGAKYFLDVDSFRSDVTPSQPYKLSIK